ncbi:MAG: OsmC family protein, partial [Ktedonobacterales bacterium]|nr:OsmC family protein [Ktedonobacterales bacterium]
AKTFSRATRVTFANRPEVAMSAAPEFGGDAGRLNPEELFTASLAACQMLTYLHMAARSGVAVVSYVDASEGELAFHEGKLRMTRVTLRPAITIAAGSDPTLAEALVERAHAECFIASSVTTEVHTEATITVA